MDTKEQQVLGQAHRLVDERIQKAGEIRVTLADILSLARFERDKTERNQTDGKRQRPTEIRWVE